jgi:UDP:flavonoid glycosyltransferase YjiC (YdhE family)
LYGVCGEGMGHASRSDVIARHLQSQGHQVQFACSSGRALSYLRAQYGDHAAIEIPGFKLTVEANRVQLTRTLLDNAMSQLFSSASNIVSALSVSEPDVVISDFDAWTARYAKLLRKPLLAIDNIHFLTRCHHPPEWVDAHKGDAAAAMLVTQLAVPDALYYFVLSFTKQAPVSQPLTGLQLPVVRDSILRLREPKNREQNQEREREASRRPGAHSVGGNSVGGLLAYFNDRAAWSSILAVLQRAGLPVLAYGCPGVKERQKVGNVTLCPFSETQLAADLAGCRAAVSGAGFSLMSEALALQKPLLAIPFAASFEQILNARYLDREGFGTWAESLSDEGLGRFLERAGSYKQRLQALPSGNEELFRNLDRMLASV